MYGPLGLFFFLIELVSHLEAAVVRAGEDPAILDVDGADSGDVAVEQLGQHQRPVWQEAETEREVG